MKLDPDPELGARLERALPPPSAGYGQKERIRRSLEGRLAGERRNVLAIWVVVAALLALVAVIVWPRHGSVTADASGRRSLLTLATARIVVRSGAELAVDRDDASGTVVRLVSGAILVHVQKGTGRPFSVVAGTVRIDVIGTIFAVSRHAESVVVDVTEGVVRVTDPAGVHTTHAGEHYPADAAALRPSAEEMVLLTSHFPPGASERRELSTPQAAPAVQHDAGAAGIPSRGVTWPRPAQSPATDAYTAARDLERSGATDAALSAYAAVMKHAGPNAEDALFAIVRVHAQRGENALAVDAANEYRTRFPQGRYARAVDVHALNARLALGDDDAVLRDSDRFLARFAADPRAFRFRLARATVRARRGDCHGALEDLDGVPDSDAKQAVSAACAGAVR